MNQGTGPATARNPACLDRAELAAALDRQGFALTPPLLDEAACAGLRDLFDRPERFRKTVDMARHAYGSGLYRYFAYPLPEPVASLRRDFYAVLAPVAGSMAAALRQRCDFPPTLEGYLAECHAAGQERPTPLMLRYGAGDYNRLHQDLYGPLHFPLQVVIGLHAPGIDYEGGEFLLMENRPRQQSIGTAVSIPQGAALVFPVFARPVHGRRGPVRATIRHGVSRLRHGNRLTLGLIFHDAT